MTVLIVFTVAYEYGEVKLTLANWIALLWYAMPWHLKFNVNNITMELGCHSKK